MGSTSRARGAAMAVAALLAGAAPSAAKSLLSPVRGGGTSLAGVARVQKLALDRTALADLRARDHALVAGFPLGGKRRADLVLVRFDPFAPGARVEVMEPGGARELTLPDEVYFHGTVAGESDSHVLLVAGPDRVDGDRPERHAGRGAELLERPGEQHGDDRRSAHGRPLRLREERAGRRRVHRRALQPELGLRRVTGGRRLRPVAAVADLGRARPLARARPQLRLTPHALLLAADRPLLQPGGRLLLRQRRRVAGDGDELL